MIAAALAVLYNILAALFAAPIQAAGKTIAVATLRPWRERRAVRRFFAFPGPHMVVFAYPPRQEEPGSILPRVAGEDFMAISQILQSVTGAGLSRQRIRMAKIERNTPVPDGHLILICVPRSNPMAGPALDLIRNSGGVDIRFVVEPLPDGAGAETVAAAHPVQTQPPVKPPQHLEFNGRPYPSPTYEAEEKIRLAGGQVWAGQMTDYAVIARSRNLFDHMRATKMFVVAGIRGIGTWGAAQHLCQFASDLYDTFQDGDFAAVVQVDYCNFAIVETRIVESYPARDWSR